MEITVFSALIIFGVVFFILKAGLPSGKIGIAIFSLIFLAILGISIFYFKSFKRESIIYAFLKQINLEKSNSANVAIETEKETFEYFRLQNKAMWEGLGLSVVSGVLFLSRTFLLITFLGKHTGFAIAVSVLGFSYLATILPIPAAIGSHELVQSFVFNGFGLGANTGVAFALAIRSADTILALIGSVFFVKFGIQIIENYLVRKIKNLFNQREGEG